MARVLVVEDTMEGDDANSNVVDGVDTCERFWNTLVAMCPCNTNHINTVETKARGNIMKLEYRGDILSVRELEDTIRATKKYTKGAFSKAISHPIQGEQFPSKVLTEYYEVYPDMELGWDMRAGAAWAWVWGDVMHINITFLYDYRDNKAKVTIHGGEGAVKELRTGIPGFHAALERIKRDETSGGGTKAANTGQDTNGNSSPPSDSSPLNRTGMSEIRHYVLSTLGGDPATFVCTPTAHFTF